MNKTNLEKPWKCKKIKKTQEMSRSQIEIEKTRIIIRKSRGKPKKIIRPIRKNKENKGKFGHSENTRKNSRRNDTRLHYTPPPYMLINWITLLLLYTTLYFLHYTTLHFTTTGRSAKICDRTSNDSVKFVFF